MAKTPEAKVKQTVVKQLKEFNCYYFYPVTGGFGRSGVPDIICCYNGYFIAIECKAGNNKPTALQELAIANIKKAGGIAIVVNEQNAQQVSKLLETL